ncbi:MAG: carboxylating nicotinate-nucleotide diphosphorylase [bacterium]
MKHLNLDHLNRFLDISLKEDHSSKDITSAILFNRYKRAKSIIISKEKGILSGSFIIPLILKKVKWKISCSNLVKDGNQIFNNSKIAELDGDLRGILAVERLILNILGHLSGIASLTGKYVKAVSGTRSRILDTRKTKPGLRELEKYAVRCGGGYNHRYNLEDMVLVKDNHIASTSFDGLKRACDYWKKHNMPIEIEVDSINLLKKVIKLNPDIIMLDNFDCKKIKTAIKFINHYNKNNKIKKVLTEVSGNVNIKNIRSIAKLGVDRISVGAITHSAPHLDFSLEIL